MKIRKLLKKLGLGILFLILAFSLFTTYAYQTWRNTRIESLTTESLVAETELGTVEYLLTGESGPVVLFLHGMPGGYDQAPEHWPGYRLLSPSRPGYLRTGLELGHTPLEQAKVYAALLNALNIEKVVLLGVSGGGPSAIQFANEYPERTYALIMMQAISQPLPNGGNIHWTVQSDFIYWAMMQTLIRTAGYPALVATQISRPNQQTEILNDPSRLNRLEEVVWSIWPPSKRVSGWQNDMYQVNDLELPSGSVNVPTLIIHGTEDTTVPFAHSQELSQEIEGSELLVIDGAGHAMPLTHDTEVRQASLEFLSNHILEGSN